MSNYVELVESMRETFYAGKTRPLNFRIQQLNSLQKMLEDNKAQLSAALSADLKRNKFENYLFEIDFTLNELKHMLMHIKEWSAPEKPPKSIANVFDDVIIYKEPYGVVLIIGPWNYPLQSVILPAIGAIAAGNCVIIKPSEVSAATSQVISELVSKYLDNECYKVVLGGIDETTELLKQKFDYIFYTGSTKVGRIIREASNKYLTPVTLELGGKSPVYIDNTADVSIAVKRVLWGKFVNMGQTCIAPDYILCSKKVQNEFVKEAQVTIKEWYGENPQKSPNLGRIVNGNHYQRLINLLKDGDVVVGGQVDSSDNYIAPTVVINVKSTDSIMKEEIFGPILPIINVDNVNEAIKFINEREHPLAEYIFTKDINIQNQIISETQAGTVCVNDVIMQAGVDTLPFGGVGESGMGAYHGKLTFDTFVHPKGCLVRNLTKFDERLISFRYPPYSEKNLKLATKLIKKRSDIPGKKYLPYILIFSMGIAVSIAFKAIAKGYGYED